MLYAEAPSSELEAPGDHLILVESTQGYELVCTERSEGNVLLRLLEEFGAYCSQIFRFEEPSEIEPLRLVWTSGDSEIQGDLAPWELSWGSLNQVVITIRNGARKESRIFYEALAAGWLMREAHAVAGMEAVGLIPQWLISGLALDYLEGRFPGAHGAWSDASRTGESLSLESVLDMTYVDTSESWARACQAWQLFDGIMGLSAGKKESAQVALSLLAGRDPRLFISSRVFRSETPSAALAEVWWATEWDKYVWDTEQRARAIDLSRADLERLAYWSLQQEGESVWSAASFFLNHEEAWSPELTLAVEQRVNTIKWSIAKINPVYANALHSLGLFYEALLLGKRSEALDVWKTFASDLNAGLEVWQAIQKGK